MTLTNVAVWDKAQEIGVDFKGHDDIESYIKDSYGITDGTPTSTETNDDAAEEETNEEDGGDD